MQLLTRCLPHPQGIQLRLTFECLCRCRAGRAGGERKCVSSGSNRPSFSFCSTPQMCLLTTDGESTCGRLAELMALLSAHPDELITLPAGRYEWSRSRCCMGTLMACGSESFARKDAVCGTVVRTPLNKEMLRWTLIVQD